VDKMAKMSTDRGNGGMMLNQRIRAAIARFRQELPADLSALIEQGAGEISALDIADRALRVGDAAPDFKLNNQRGEERTLAEYQRRGDVVVTFYRGVWCPYCNLQIKEYADRIDEIAGAGAALVAITPEKPDALAAHRANGVADEVLEGAPTSVPFDILHDQENRVASAFGLTFELPESHRKLLQMLKVDVVAANGDGSYTFPDPATFVIRRSGQVAWAFVPNNYRRRAEVNDIVHALRKP